MSSITNVSEETNYTGGPFVNEPMGGEMDIDRPSEIVIEQKDAVEKNWHYCGECGKKFSRQHDLHRHEKTKHATDCEIYLCGHCRKKEDTRKDKLLEHIRKTHGENTNDGTSAICILLGCKTGKFAGAMFANNVRLSEHENSGHIDRLKYANADRAINGQKRNSGEFPE